MTRARAKELLKRFTRTRILVVGDLILDEFIRGTVERISPEAPVPVVWADGESAMPGGAANVACGVRALGGQAELLGVVGDDAPGRRLREELIARGIPASGVLTDPLRPTTAKTRVIANRQQVVRIDRERVAPVAGAALNRLLKEAGRLIPQVDGVIVEDYGKGLIHPRLLKPLIGLAKRNRKVIAVDPKEDHASYYRGVTALTPNKKEAASAAGCVIRDEADLFRAGRRILQKLRPEVLLVTLGEEGMMLFPSDGKKPVRIPTVAREVFDVSGAGDTVIACFTLARAAGGSFLESAVLANAAAGVVVGKAGTAVCSPEELIGSL